MAPGILLYVHFLKLCPLSANVSFTGGSVVKLVTQSMTHNVYCFHCHIYQSGLKCFYNKMLAISLELLFLELK